MPGDEPHYLQRELEELVRSDSAVFTFLQETSLDGLWYWDLENPDHEYMDQRFWRLLGVDPEEKRHLASEWRDLIFAEDLEAVQRNLEAHYADASHPYDQVIRFRHRDGSTVWVRSRGIAIRDEAGRPVRMLGAQNDLTAFKRTEEEARAQTAELRRARDAARAADLAKSEFLANMSHEIRTPLNASIGLTEAVLRSQLSDEQREQLQVALGASESLLRILNDLLDLAKIEAGKIALHEAPFLLADVLEEVLRPLRSAAQEKNIDLSCLVAEDVPATAVGDAGRLRQILMNLVGNAVKFTDRGEVVLRVERDNGPAPLQMRFSVRDTGIGAPAEIIDSLFDSFQQAERSTTKRRQGLGLGLAICRRLVEMMDGTIRAESTLGEGSLFEFSAGFDFPTRVSEIARDERERAAISPSRQDRPLEILLAEDTESSRKVVFAMLDGTPHNITVAGNGRKALDLVATRDFDLVLMDIEMPELDGYETTRAIRAREAATGRERVPIIAITAHAMMGTREKCLSLGMDDYLSKPVRLDQFRAAISRAARPH